jgi:hypothetical protein
MAGDWQGAEEDATWALEAGAADAESPIGRYAATLALLVLERDDVALTLASSLRDSDDFPDDVARALVAIASRDSKPYDDAVRSVLRSFETREEYLEDIPVADTVIVLEALAARRGLAVELESDLLPN